MKDRNTHDNILLAQVSAIKKNAIGFNIIIKLDIAKAYDSLNWFALIKITRRFDFCERCG